MRSARKREAEGEPRASELPDAQCPPCSEPGTLGTLADQLIRTLLIRSQVKLEGLESGHVEERRLFRAGGNQELWIKEGLRWRWEPSLQGLQGPPFPCLSSHPDRAQFLVSGGSEHAYVHHKSQV